MKTEHSELTRQDLIVGHVYEAKNKQTNVYREINDRQILWIGKEFYKDEYQEVIQYDSPTIRAGSHYPKVSVAQFLKWAKSPTPQKLRCVKWLSSTCSATNPLTAINTLAKAIS